MHTKRGLTLNLWRKTVVTRRQPIAPLLRDLRLINMKTSVGKYSNRSQISNKTSMWELRVSSGKLTNLMKEWIQSSRNLKKQSSIKSALR